MKYSIVIATHNRASDLRGTLASLSMLVTRDPWEVVVVDNNCTDETPDVVREWAQRFPVPLRYATETEPGRCAALNTGMAIARGEIIVTTDDDVRVEPDWLDCAGRELERLRCDYIGGRVLPIWGGPRPAWLPNRPGRHWAVIALLDYGSDPIEFDRKIPLGVNMAFRREAFTTVGPWDPRIGRKAGTLLGQEVREWCVRARSKGVRGFYTPALSLRHIIPASRLNKRYFRRFFYWRGISRALLYRQRGLDMESPQETRLDFRRVPHWFGIPRYMYRTLLSSAWRAFTSYLKGDAETGFEQELYVWMFLGIARQRWRDRHAPAEWLAPRQDGRGGPDSVVEARIA
ncbi:MAG TPA: glycosyltransferase [Vicinamibacterales bacterium]|nr:glycosyltransferase [Vicinamibacterales bacterium]